MKATAGSIIRPKNDATTDNSFGACWVIPPDCLVVESVDSDGDLMVIVPSFLDRFPMDSSADDQWILSSSFWRYELLAV